MIIETLVAQINQLLDSAGKTGHVYSHEDAEGKVHLMKRGPVCGEPMGACRGLSEGEAVLVLQGFKSALYAIL